MMRRTSSEDATLLDLLTEKLSGPREIGASAPVSFEDSLTNYLQVLLNSRRQEELVPPEFEECFTSVMNFGVIDLTGRGSLQTAAEQMLLCRSFEQAVRQFEPRLRKVTVRPLDAKEHSPFVRLRLEAWAELTAEHVGFEIRLKRDTGEISVLSR